MTQASAFQNTPSSGDVTAASATLGGRETSKTILYFGNLIRSITEDQVKDIVQAAGPVVSVKIMQDKNKVDFNYAFVEFADEAAAAEAIHSFNGTSIDGHEIVINHAYRSSSFASSQNVEGQLFSIFVGDLSLEVNDEALRSFFSDFASLKQAHVMWDMQTSRSRGYGFATFHDAADAQAALHTMNGRIFHGRAVRLNWASHRLSAPKPLRGYKKNFRTQSQTLGFDYTYSNPQDMSYGNGYAYPGGYNNMGDNFPNLYGSGFGNSYADASSVPFSNNFTDPYSVKFPDSAATGYTASGSGTDGFSDLSTPATAASGDLLVVSALDHGSKEPMINLKFDVAARQTPGWQTTVYIGNIAYYTQESDLIPLLQSFGYILDLKFYPEKGCAFVKFDTHERAALAIVQLAGFALNGRPLKCGWGRSRPPQNSYAGISGQYLGKH